MKNILTIAAALILSAACMLTLASCVNSDNLDGDNDGIVGDDNGKLTDGIYGDDSRDGVMTDDIMPGGSDSVNGNDSFDGNDENNDAFGGDGLLGDNEVVPGGNDIDPELGIGTDGTQENIGD